MAQHQHSMMSIPFEEHGIPVYRACQGGKPKAAIILIHEVWGLTEHIKDVADRFCEEDYLVIAPDLMANTDMSKVIKPELQKVIFDPVERPKHQVELRAMMAPLSSPEFAQATLDKLKVIFKYLKDEGENSVFVIGYCFGGTYAFGLAVNQTDLAGAIAYYGHGEQYIDKIGNIDCPVMLFAGEKDTAITERIPDIEKAMKDAGKEFTYHVYPDAGHAFFNDTNSMSYNPAAAEQAWAQTLTFLELNS